MQTSPRVRVTLIRFALAPIMHITSLSIEVFNHPQGFFTRSPGSQNHGYVLNTSLSEIPIQFFQYFISPKIVIHYIAENKSLYNFLLDEYLLHEQDFYI